MPYQKDDRRYYPTPLGDLRSVTSYQDEMAKPALIGWAANVTAEYFKDHLALIKSGEMDPTQMPVETIVKEAKAHHKMMQEQAMDLGSAVHKAVEDYFRFGPVPEDEVVRVLARAAEVAIVKDLDFTLNNCELEVYSRDGYAGTLDLVGMVKPKGHRRAKLAVIDLKTSKAVYEEYKMQVAAYAHAYEEMTGNKVELAIIQRIDKQTGFADKPVIMSRATWLKHYRVFKKLVKFADAKDKLKPRRKKKEV
jgi:CRISPR/Cas system-associated exonuclease Cas4 (RecB family)